MELKFKEGDKVRCARLAPTTRELRTGFEYVITKSFWDGKDGEEVVWVEGLQGCWSAFQFELVQDELQQLVDTANAGYRAVEKLQAYRNKLQYRSGHSDLEWEDYSSYGDFQKNKVGREFRVSPKSKDFKWKGFDVKIMKNMVKIGCKEFNGTDLVRDLGQIIKGRLPYGMPQDMVVVRNGLSTRDGEFTWGQLEELHKLLLENYHD
jgi:hypothetical protein